MKERIAKVKTHLRENKKTYIACGGTAVVAVLGTLAVVSRGNVTISRQSITQVLSWKPEAHQHLEVWIEALGDPGNIIQDVETGIIYASQGQAARELGLNPSDVSKHLKGATNHVGGHMFTKLGKAMVSSG